MLSEVIEQLITKPVAKWKTEHYSIDHTWTIATSKELMGEFKSLCEAAELDWRGVLSRAVHEYESKHDEAPLRSLKKSS